MNPKPITKILFYSLFLTFTGCFVNDFTEPLIEANYRDQGDKITRSDAQQLILGNILAFSLRCPRFGQDPDRYWSLTWFSMLSSSGCSPDDIFVGDTLIRGCAEQHFVNRDDIEGCRVLIDLGDCKELEESVPARHLATYNICANALRSDVPFPFLSFY